MIAGIAFATATHSIGSKGRKMSLRAVSAELATQGYLNERGKPFNPKSVAAMVAGR